MLYPTLIIIKTEIKNPKVYKIFNIELDVFRENPIWKLEKNMFRSRQIS